MLAIERRQEIMQQLKDEKSVRVNELAVKYNVTEETIRRDLDTLSKDGKVIKIYGGAVLDEPVSEDISFIERKKVNMEAKKRIASYAAGLIEDGETIFVGMSTTAIEVVKAVSASKNITVVTNSLEAMIALGQKSNIRLITLGGTFDPINLFSGGAMTHRYLDHYYVDKAFISVKAISTERGIMDSKEDIAEIKARMVKNSKQAILVIDGSKFDKSALVNVIGTDEIDMLVTDRILDRQWREYLESNGIEAIEV